MSRLKISHLPKTPGVYLFKNFKGRVIYVGKAQDIKVRVKNHFQKTGETLDFKKNLMLSQISKVDYIEVDSEVEALLLEANLIKKYQPKYNTRLKDDKSYLYIKVTTGDDFPKVLTARRPTPERSDGGQARREKIPGAIYFGASQNTSRKAQYNCHQLHKPRAQYNCHQLHKPKAQYFGPFPSAKTVRNTLKSLRRIFPYCNCSFASCQRKKSCFYVEIGLDVGPCLELIGKSEYRQIIRRLILLLRGQKEKLLRELTRAMAASAKKEEFEKAQDLKKQIEGIEYLTRPVTSPQIYLEDPEYLAKRRQAGLLELKKILSLAKIPQRIECFDISDIHGREASGSMVVFSKGESDKSQYRHFKVQLKGQNDAAMIQEAVGRRLRHLEWPQADLIVVDGGKGQVSGVQATLSETGLQTPLIGLAKRLEEIIIPERVDLQKNLEFKTLRLRQDSPALHLLRALRDEAHRFALIYHRKLRIRSLYEK